MALNVILTCLVAVSALNIMLVCDLYGRSAKLVQLHAGATEAMRRLKHLIEHQG